MTHIKISQRDFPNAVVYYFNANCKSPKNNSISIVLKHFNSRAFTGSVLAVTQIMKGREFLVSTSIRNEWRSCWSSKQRFPTPKRKPECSVCHWCHRQQTTLQTANKAAGVFTPKHRGPYLFKPHTLCVPPCFYWRCALMVPTSDSLSVASVTYDCHASPSPSTSPHPQRARSISTQHGEQGAGFRRGLPVGGCEQAEEAEQCLLKITFGMHR